MHRWQRLRSPLALPTLPTLFSLLALGGCGVPVGRRARPAARIVPVPAARRGHRLPHRGHHRLRHRGHHRLRRRGHHRLRRRGQSRAPAAPHHGLRRRGHERVGGFQWHQHELAAHDGSLPQQLHDHGQWQPAGGTRPRGAVRLQLLRPFQVDGWRRDMEPHWRPRMAGRDRLRGCGIQRPRRAGGGRRNRQHRDRQSLARGDGPAGSGHEAPDSPRRTWSAASPWTKPAR